MQDTSRLFHSASIASLFLLLACIGRAEAFFISLLYSAEDYIALNCTKAASVYRLLGNPPKSHERSSAVSAGR